MNALPATFDRQESQPVLTVSALTLLVKEIVEGSFPLVWVSGEVSNFSRPQSGHCYLTLKDDEAQLRAVIWRGTAATVRCDLHDGLEVICRGHLDVYAARGTYQLVIEEIHPKGLGRWSRPCGSCGRSWLARGCSKPPASGRCRLFRGESRW